jgi:hypothetical protein
MHVTVGEQDGLTVIMVTSPLYVAGVALKLLVKQNHLPATNGGKNRNALKNKVEKLQDRWMPD